MDEVIRAMADEIAQIEADREGYPLSRTWDEIYEDAWGMATAAYNAMRAKLVPVMYAVEEEGHPIISYITREKPTEQATSVTPLYALPEIDNG